MSSDTHHPTSADPPPVLRITNVNHTFGSGETATPVLMDINLTVHAGEVVILGGPSGCGKTTLLTLIGGLRKLQSGQIEVWDDASGTARGLLGMGEAELVVVRRLIGFIFQRHNLFDSLTAMENVPAWGSGWDRPRPTPTRTFACSCGTSCSGANILSETQQPKYLSKPAGLSGGQRQRVAIARALDQPTGAGAGRRADRRPGLQLGTGSRHAPPPTGRRPSRVRTPAPGPQTRRSRPRRRAWRTGRYPSSVPLSSEPGPRA